MVVAIITGCTNGLGLHALKNVAADSTVTTIFLACRNVEAAKSCAAEVAASAKCPVEKLVVLPEPCNLADVPSMKVYTDALLRYLRLNNLQVGCLINNAGIGGSPFYKKTAQGYDLIWASNHLGHFMLTLSLLPVMAAGAVVVNVASDVHDPAAKTPLPDPSQQWPTTPEAYEHTLAAGEPLEGEDSQTSGGRRYSRSKLCNVLFTYQLALRLSGTLPFGIDPASETGAALCASPARSCCSLPHASSIRVLGFNPGLMLDSNFVSAIAGGGIIGSVVGGAAYLLTPLLRLIPFVNRAMRTSAESGKVLAELGLGKIGAGVTAAYFDKNTLFASSEFSRSYEGAVTAARELWEHSILWGQVDEGVLKAAGMKHD